MESTDAHILNSEPQFSTLAHIASMRVVGGHPYDSQGLFVLVKDQRPLNVFISFSTSGDDLSE